MKERRLFVIGNWKMNPQTAAEATELFMDVVASVRTLRGVQAVVCPPFVYLAECRKRYRGKALLLGAQDLSAAVSGAHTGEISGGMLRSIGATHVIIGHSERRAAGESDEVINQKIKTALAQGLTVVLCIGERDRDDRGEYLHVISNQLVEALRGIPAAALDKLVIAYEPVWAIGKTAAQAMKPETMHETGLYIRKVLSQLYGMAPARSLSVLYGGSVEPENAEALFARGDIDGFLVGHASLAAESFGAILKVAHAAAKERTQ